VGSKTRHRSVPQQSSSRADAAARALFKAWEAMHETPPSTLYHYTTADGLIGMLQSRQIWATNVRFMNDTSELAYGIRLVRAVFEKIGARVIRGRARNTLLYEIVRAGVSEMLDDAERNTIHYAASFCTNGNLLSQWRGYGQSGGGFALGFVAKRLHGFAAEFLPNAPVKPEQVPVFLRKVMYDPKAQEALVHQWITSLLQQLRTASSRAVPSAAEIWRTEAAQIVARLVYEALVCFKHPGFAEEEEWRLIQQGRVGSQDLCKVSFRARTGRIISYSPLTYQNAADHFPVAAITFGPTLDGQASERALRMLLESHGFNAEAVQIHASGIPFTT
jgi:hypothetical protein